MGPRPIPKKGCESPEQVEKVSKIKLEIMKKTHVSTYLDHDKNTTEIWCP